METSFSFTLIWSLYRAIFGQAIPSAFGLFALAQTTEATLFSVNLGSNNPHDA